jgi:hypothetical protein
MIAKATAKHKSPFRPALQALRRAAKKAIELARMIGTPTYLVQNARIENAARWTRKPRR